MLLARLSPKLAASAGAACHSGEASVSSRYDSMMTRPRPLPRGRDASILAERAFILASSSWRLGSRSFDGGGGGGGFLPPSLARCAARAPS